MATAKSRWSLSRTVVSNTFRLSQGLSGAVFRRDYGKVAVASFRMAVNGDSAIVGQGVDAGGRV